MIGTGGPFGSRVARFSPRLVPLVGLLAVLALRPLAPCYGRLLLPAVAAMLLLLAAACCLMPGACRPLLCLVLPYAVSSCFPPGAWVFLPPLLVLPLSPRVPSYISVLYQASDGLYLN